jgi:hypothetical protein
MELDVASHQFARCDIPIRELESELIVSSRLPVVRDRDLIGPRLAIDLGCPSDSPSGWTNNLIARTPVAWPLNDGFAGSEKPGAGPARENANRPNAAHFQTNIIPFFICSSVADRWSHPRS